MSSPSIDELLEVDKAPSISFSGLQIAEVVARIQTENRRSKWETNVKLTFDDKKWVPPAVSNSKKDVLYVTLQTEIPQYASVRLSLARSKGLHVYVALMTISLYQPQVLDFLASVDANIFVIDDCDKSRSFKPRHFMAAMADLGIPVSPDVRKRLSRQIWEQMGSGTKQEKGRRLEAFLAYLLAQVNDLRVVERNYRTDTQEIDILLRTDNVSDRVWQESGVPFILVEAKNRKDKATQQVVSVFVTKLLTKRQRARIGLLFSVGGFTEDAKREELRYSQSSICVVMLDSKAISELIEADNLDEQLESIVERAMVR